MKKYDYIFIGAGCAGLSLLTRMVTTGLSKEKKILVIDKSRKQVNDRTWCFWENQPGFFEPIVYRQWSQLWFHTPAFSKQLTIDPYCYKMIRGIDFYNHCFSIIQASPGIEFIYGDVDQAVFSNNTLHCAIDGQPRHFDASVVFNAVYNETVAKQQSGVYLLQHFKGWTIETPGAVFSPGEATLMDFRTSQANGTTFVYVLPLSANRALVEYTLFSEHVLPAGTYAKALAEYISGHLQLNDYTITEEEFGVIPMTDARFPWYVNGMYQLGTAGGQTKASSGYTFRFIQKQSEAIVQQIMQNKLSPASNPGTSKKRFNFYDAVLLRVLAKHYAAGSDVFARLFEKNKPQAIFSFLDNESSAWQDLSIIASLPTGPFLKAALQQIG